jgi:hypothetical protein
MSDDLDWAPCLATAIASKLAERTWEVRVRSVKVAARDVVEVIYTDSLDADPKGIRLDLGSVRLGPERIRALSIDELAFDLIYLGMCEPRSIEDFLPPDSDGVRWLPAHQWLE